MAIPAGSPKVYGDLEHGSIAGGLSTELADVALDAITNRLGLPESHLSHLVGFTCDGQYMAAGFRQRIGDRMRLETNDDFAVPIVWDPGHLMNLAVTDVKEGKSGTSSATLTTFISRCNVVNEEMNRGKGYAVLRAVAADSVAHVPTKYAHQRFFSSAMEQWVNLEKSYETLISSWEQPKEPRRRR